MYLDIFTLRARAERAGKIFCVVKKISGFFLRTAPSSRDTRLVSFNSCLILYAHKMYIASIFANTLFLNKNLFCKNLRPKNA